MIPIKFPLRMLSTVPGCVVDADGEIIFRDATRPRRAVEVVERINAAAEMASALRNVLPVAKEAAADGPLSRAVLSAAVALDRWDGQWQPELTEEQKAALDDAADAMQNARKFPIQEDPCEE